MTARTEVALLDAAAAAAGDQAAVEAGATWSGLMERAAGHLARGVVDAAGFAYGLRVAVLAGKGNNGGDGWAAARRLADFGATASVVSTHGLDADMSAEAEANRNRWLDGDGVAGGRAGGMDTLGDTLDWADVVVDCMLGTGATGAPRGAIGEAVAALNEVVAADGTTVVACDVPTGVQGDDGAVPGAAVRADLTVTLGAMKRGLVAHPGTVHAGRVVVGELGRNWRVPDGGRAADPDGEGWEGPDSEGPEIPWSALTAAGAAPPALDADADKRARGVVLVVAGSRGMAGAAILCARGALAAGAGLVTVAVPASIQDVVASRLPPAMTVGLAEDHAGVLDAAAVDDLAERAGEADAVVAGPGLTHGPGVRAVVDALRTTAPRLVLDADALNVYRGEGYRLADHAGDLVITPQHRELARLTPGYGTADADAAGWDGEDWGVEGGRDALRRRPELAPRLAERLDATVVAKGPATMVASADGRLRVTPTGGPHLGAGGTGDVLAGATAAALAPTDNPADNPGDNPDGSHGGVPEHGGAHGPALAVARACWWGGLAGHLAGRGRAGRPTSAAMARALPRALALTSRLAADRPRWPFDPSGFRHDREPPERPTDAPGPARGGRPRGRRWGLVTVPRLRRHCSPVGARL